MRGDWTDGGGAARRPYRAYDYRSRDNPPAQRQSVLCSANSIRATPNSKLRRSFLRHFHMDPRFRPFRRQSQILTPCFPLFSPHVPHPLALSMRLFLAPPLSPVAPPRRIGGFRWMLRYYPTSQRACLPPAERRPRVAPETHSSTLRRIPPPISITALRRAVRCYHFLPDYLRVLNRPHPPRRSDFVWAPRMGHAA